jgi:hypothetical protein
MSNSITLQLNVGGSIDLVLRPPAPEATTLISVHYEGFSATVKATHMAYTLGIDHLIVIQVGYVDTAGNPARVDSVTWSASNPTLASVTPDPNDQTMCKVQPLGGLGTCQIVADADADLGEGVRHIMTTFDLSLVGGEAVSGAINLVGDPQPIEAHPEQQGPA